MRASVAVRTFKPRWKPRARFPAHSLRRGRHVSYAPDYPGSASFNSRGKCR
jgi:hypothetical protein